MPKFMIKINRIEPQKVMLYNPKGKLMGLINEYEFNDIRIQIKKTQSEGYYCIFNGQRFDINKDGRGKNWFTGFFDLIECQLMNLL